ncbi:ATP-binding protein [Streptomyces sp. NPDC050400]|uniref:ATP-binding protein n=1 Tax=Streptomyces sp. NPDC050400 TaxID=3365610 RepID=UPI0037A5A19C
MPANAFPQLPVTVRTFTQRLSSTPRGARLARILVTQHLHEWGHPYGSDASEALTLVTAELAANAVRHGRVPGRDFRVRLLAYGDRSLRVEVTDQRGERLPEPGGRGGDGGRGLVLVEALATRWGVRAHAPGEPGKTVWAELDAPSAVDHK